ncbi:MAG: hypothetical protein L3J20_11805 [Flavobacteriaceae bacterium]|nr:hypothetical protein [Flavobacteriaceae bacterium]
MTLLELIKLIKIDFTQGLINKDSGSELEHHFEISSKEFLNYCKKDFKLKNRRGQINALTNAKRAIDCKTDEIFLSIGLDPYNFPKAIEEFISISNRANSKSDIPIKLKFLQVINFAPTRIIADVRTLRNKLEHFYTSPHEEQVSNAIELAELYSNHLAFRESKIPSPKLSY